MKDFYKNGFTLIELLFVVSIIALLTSLTVSELDKARMKARNVVRLNDIHQIQNALELYNNKNGEYPPNLLVLVSAGFLPGEPKDPVSDPDRLLQYVYDPDGDFSSYILLFNVEPNGLAINCPKNSTPYNYDGAGSDDYCSIRK